MPAPYKLTWTDRRGAGRCVSTSDLAEIERRLSKLRCTAEVRNSDGLLIGECHDRHAGDLPGNARWTWHLDHEG